MGVLDRPQSADAHPRAREAVRGVADATAAIAEAAIAGDQASVRAAIARGAHAAVGVACEVILEADGAAPAVTRTGPTVALRVGAQVVGALAFAEALTDDEIAIAEALTGPAALALIHAHGQRELAAAREASMNRVSRFARLGESGTLGILISTGRNTVLEVNDTLAAMFGFSREELCAPGFDWATRTPPEYVALDQRAIVELQTTGTAALREKEYLRRDGSRFAAIVGSAMVEGTAGECISFYLDVSDRKRAQHEAQRLREEAAVSARLAAVVESSGDAIIGVALDGTITSWNRGAARTFGYAAAEAVGDRIRMLTPIGREDENAAIRERMRQGEVVEMDTVRRRKDGVEIDVALTVSPIFDSAGVVDAVSIVAHDITARRRAAEQLARARDEAEAASRELEAFSYSVAHDLRAPLRGISGFAKVLLDDYADKLDADGRDCLDEVRGGAQRMAALIDALLSLARVTRTELRRERVELAALVQACVAELAAAEPTRRVELVAPEAAYVHLDPRLARSLVENLVGNAWKFTRDVPVARIELGRAADGTLFVRDNGAGFDMAHAAKLFAPFQRLHTVHEFPGTGIGLATVQRIVLRHGGRIWADAAVGQGATFYFTIPTDGSEAQP